MNPIVNEKQRGTILASDPPQHTFQRKIVERPLTPAQLKRLREQIFSLAEARVDELVSRGRFCAASELATYLPLTVVSQLVGLPEEGRERMLDWAAAAFNSIAPADSPYFQKSLPLMGEAVSFINDPSLPDKLVPGSWAAQLYEAVKAGEISQEAFRGLIQAYVTPSLDTTIFGITNLIWLFAHYPDQWQLLRRQPALVSRAINEALRIKSPVSGFSRLVTHNIDVDGVTLPKGSRVVMLFASGNRDERRYKDPDRFDIQRDSSDHLAFGHSRHRCVGMNLALLEITALVDALLPRVKEFEIEHERRADNASLHGYAELIVNVS